MEDRKNGISMEDLRFCDLYWILLVSEKYLLQSL